MRIRQTAIAAGVAIVGAAALAAGAFTVAANADSTKTKTSVSTPSSSAPRAVADDSAPPAGSTTGERPANK